MTRIKPGSLKCVVLASPGDRAAVLQTLTDRIGGDDVRPFGVSAVLVHTEEETSSVRDWLHSAGGALVVEFEKWSGLGREVPRQWLLARGH